MVPSTALKLVQIGIISAVILNEGDHDVAADSMPTRATLPDQSAHETGCDTMARSVELVHYGDGAKTQI
jgi:hypothetical protein